MISNRFGEFFKNITEVSDSISRNSSKHLYILFDSKKKLITTPDKKLANSISDFFQVISHHTDHFSDKEKISLLKKVKIISDAYKSKHNGIIARIIRFFLSFYKQKHEETLSVINQLHNELETSCLEKQFKRDLAKAHANPEEKIFLFKQAEEIALFHIEAGNFEKAMQIRLSTAQALSPTSSLKDILIKLEGEDPRLGLHLPSIGASLFKHQTLTLQRRTFTDGKTHLHLEGKLSRPGRDSLQSTIDYITREPRQFWSALPSGFCDKVIISAEKAKFYGRTAKGEKQFEGNFSKDLDQHGYVFSQLFSDKEVQVIDFQGVGKVKIGMNPEVKCLYNRIEIDLDPAIPPEKTAETLHLLLAALGLGEASTSPCKDDIERLKIMQLFRIYYPKESYLFEKDPLSFKESIESLKARMTAAVPEMRDKFKNELENMYQQEVYPGQSIWAVKGLAEEVRKEGGLCLMSGIVTDTFSNAARRLISILKLGALSSLDRLQRGIVAKGVSTGNDLYEGGAESVFARLVMKNDANIGNFYLAGQMQILYDLELIERGGYAHPKDCFGSKKPPNYDNRSNILELTKQYAKGEGYFQNEVCVRNRIPPQYIQGVCVNTATEKEQLINSLRTEGFLHKNDQQLECVNGILVDQFIRINPL